MELPRLPGLSLNPDQVCSISYVSSGGGGECVTADSTHSLASLHLTRAPLLLTCSSLLVCHPIRRWQAITTAFVFIDNCSIRGALHSGCLFLLQRLGGLTVKIPSAK